MLVVKDKIIDLIRGINYKISLANIGTKLRDSNVV